jgi:endonuclease/exonuclease/phosphatase family metal-dependent hydrolase
MMAGIRQLTEAPMRILTWNIQWGRGADGRVELPRTVAAIRAAGEFDVICLQEVARNFPDLPGGAREDEPAFFAAAFPRHEAVFACGVDVPDGGGGRAQFGNLLLSALPVGQVFRHQLPSPADPGVPGMARACVEAMVETRAGWLRLMTTHLEYYSALQREAQVGALCALQQEAAAQAALPVAEGETNPVFAALPRPASAVICGDFNCEPGSPAHALMQRALAEGAPAWRDAWQLLHPGRPHPPSVGLHGAEWPDRAYCCDFFFVTEDLAPRLRRLEVLADTAASDHQPVVLELAD